jgi:hypothetical protein
LLVPSSGRLSDTAAFIAEVLIIKSVNDIQALAHNSVIAVINNTFGYAHTEKPPSTDRTVTITLYLQANEKLELEP